MMIAQACANFNIDGICGDIVVKRATDALVAFEGSDEVIAIDIQRVITICLQHRPLRDTLESIPPRDKVQKAFKQVFGLLGN
jgi:Mg-chelatase subunit ChlI